MTTKPSPQVSREADQLEAMIDALPLTGAQREKAWDVWADQGMGAALVTLKALRTKAAAHPLDAPYQALRSAYDAGDSSGIQGALQQMITACTAPAVATTAKLGDHQKPLTTKQAPGDFLEGARQVIQHTGGHIP